jgi:hypothetical protein
MHTHYLLIVNVQFEPPREIFTPKKGEFRIFRRRKTMLASGYYVNIAVKAESEDKAAQMITSDLADGVINWKESQILSFDLPQLEQRLQFRCMSPDKSGIWYRSGRIFYPV